MAVVEFSRIVIPVSDKNNFTKYVIGIKLGDREPAILNYQGSSVVFDTEDEAQAYIDDDE
jgi:hypothetical protein